MPATAIEHPQPHRYTTADYHRMSEAGILAPDVRVELIQGEVIDMTPIGSGHAGLVKHLNKLFIQTVGDAVVVGVQDPVVVDDFSEPEPDLALLRFREDFYTKSHPRPEDVLLIVEVADTTLQYDREIKLPLYAHAGIPEVWLVDVVAKSVTVCSHPEEGGYTRQVSLDDLKAVHASALEGFSFDLSGIFGE
jgi:Uma2 family endonuclease